MTDYMISQLAQDKAPAAADLLAEVDVSDTATPPAGPAGSDKQATVRDVVAAGTTMLREPTGLRRWRAMLGDALFTTAAVVVVGDSITAGQGGDNNPGTYSNIPDNSQGWAGQLRALFAAALGTYPGEGFIFSDDSRVTNNGGIANSWACVPLTHGYRLTGTQNLVLTVPDGVTQLGIIQANQTQAFNSAGSNLADVSALYSQSGSATVSNANITTLTNTGRALETFISVQPGDQVTVTAPATAQSYIVGFDLRTGNPGVLVHRVAIPGYVSGDMLGGQTSGVLNNAGNSTLITDAMRACYDWAGTQGLVATCFLGNDQQFQAGGGTARQNDVTQSLFASWMTQFMAQAIADGWSAMMFAPPRNPNAYAGGPSEDDYIASVLSWVQGNDHASLLDTGEVWGPYADSAAINLVNGTSVHPLRRGHGDMARLLYRAVASVSAGITDTVTA